MHGTIDPKKIPFKVRAIAIALKEAGGRPFIVGGSVRDVLLHKNPSDWDLAVDLDPVKVLEVFPGACTVGIDYGRLSLGDVDIVSLRSEKKYTDKRHPDEVSFGVSIDKDLERRDFTVNAIAWEPFSGEIFDPYGGIGDLKHRILSCVGDPKDRFQEDPLRILRAIRLKNTLGLNLDSSLSQAILDTKDMLCKISGERIFGEIRQLIVSGSSYSAILDLSNYGLIQILLPEIGESIEPVAKAVSACSGDLVTRFAALFHGISRHRTFDESFERIKNRFNLPSNMAQDVKWLALNSLPEETLVRETLPKGWQSIAAEQLDQDDPGYLVRRILHHWGMEQLQRLFQVKQAVWIGMGRQGISPGCLILAAGMHVLKQIETCNPFKLGLDGDDIMMLLGVKEGTIVGEALGYIEETVLRSPRLNNKEALSRILLEWWNNKQ